MKSSFFHRIIGIIILTIISSTGYSQIFTKPNDSWGTTQNRGNPDSTQYVPTFPSAPTDSMGLHSQGFNGAGQKLRKAAIYYDSTGHKAYFWDPALKAWILIGAGSGLNIGNSDLTLTGNRSLSGSDRRTLSLDSLKEFFIKDSAGNVLVDVDPLNQFINIGGLNSSGQQSSVTIDGTGGQVGLSAADGITIGSPVPGSSPLFTLRQRVDQGPFNTNLYWPRLNKVAGDTIATLQDLRLASDLDAVLNQGDTAYQKDLILSWNSRSDAFSAGVTRRFFSVHPDSVNGVFITGDVDGNRTALGMIMSQKIVFIRADSGLQIAGGGNSQFTQIKTQSAQTGGGFIQRLYLPFTGNPIDTLVTRKELADGIAASGSSIAIESNETYTTGSTWTQGSGKSYIFVNPSTFQATLTVTSLASGGAWHNSNDLYIVFGGTITSGNPVITSFSFAAGSGLTPVQAVNPNGTTFKAGEVIHYHKNGSFLYRIE